jgi:ferritin-like protein
MEQMITESSTKQTKKDGKEIRKSLAVDPATYDLLQEICTMEHRSKIDQLKVLIQKEHKRLTNEQEAEVV